MTTLTLLAALSFFAGASAGESNAVSPMTDDVLRVTALQAIFPGMRVSAIPGRRIDDSGPKKPRRAELPFPDALAGENVYRITGPAMNEAEECASSFVDDPHRSWRTRQVRLELLWWPKEEGSGMLAVIQYKFPAANPPMACPSIGVLVHLIKEGAAWRPRDQYLVTALCRGLNCWISRGTALITSSSNPTLGVREWAPAACWSSISATEALMRFYARSPAWRVAWMGARFTGNPSTWSELSRRTDDNSAS